MDCTIYIAKRKVLISCAADLRLCFCICKSRFSHDAAHIILLLHYFSFKCVVTCISIDSKSTNVLVRLARISKNCVKQTGFFFHSPTMEENFWQQEQ